MGDLARSWELPCEVGRPRANIGPKTAGQGRESAARRERYAFFAHVAAQVGARYLATARVAARNNIQIFGLGASGVGDATEFLMRQAAAQTGGRYLFLTDDSGVGNAHQEPKVSCYLVTELGELMARVLRSELTGQRVEPSPSSVIRTVGSYQNGVCRD